MNMFPFIMHIVMLERELETQQQEYQSKSDFYNYTEPARRSRKERFHWLFGMFRRNKPGNLPDERVVLTPCGCRDSGRKIDPVVSPCSRLSTDG